MAFHTTTHQINTSRRKEKSAASKQSWLHAVAPEPAGQTHWFLWTWVDFFKQKSIYWHLITWHFQVFQVCACVALSYHHYYEPWLSLAFSGVASISSTPAWVIRSAMFFSRSSMRVLISSSEAAVQEHNWHQSSWSSCTGQSSHAKLKIEQHRLFFTNKTAATAYTTEDADELKQLPRRGLRCSLTVKKCVLFEGELFQWHFNAKRQDIPPDDLVRHGLELVLHLLQESLDLQHTTHDMF